MAQAVALAEDNAAKAEGIADVLEQVERRIVMPVQKPGRSVQDVETPPEFISAVVARWGPIAFDLAATEANAKAPAYFDPEADSLRQDWTRLRGNLWLNPPFGKISPWSGKCAETIAQSPLFPSARRIFLLTPAGVSTNWFYENIYGRARVCAIQRLKFVGHEQDFPKDLILSVFGEEPGFEVWRWKESIRIDGGPDAEEE